MKAIDTSVAVPALTAGHPEHERARRMVAAERPHLPLHAAVETYAVLTRLPAPAGVPAAVAADVVERNFRQRTLALSRSATLRLLGEMAAVGIVGGATYDALIGATAREAGATLVTRDRRAAATYAQLGVDWELLAEGPARPS